MASPRVCVLRAPGTNSDIETAHAFDMCGATSERVHVFRLLENPSLLGDFQILCIPGGFSYGDDIGAGVIFSRQLRGQLGNSISEFFAADRLGLGICNGFQVLLKAGLFADQRNVDPDNPFDTGATLTWNTNNRYTALWVRLKVRSSKSVFFRGINEIDMPIAHAEGQLAVKDPDVVDGWREREQIACCYWSSGANRTNPDNDETVLPFPANPNGAVANIAGLCDSTGRILGLMPHPERFIHATQHPQWTRRSLRGDGDGLQLFRNAVEYFG